MFKEQVMIFLASPAVCADLIMQTCHGREQNNPLSSPSAGASFSTNPSARSLCQSHKDPEPQRPAAVKRSFFFGICPWLRRSSASILSVPPQRERPLAQGRSEAALQGAEPARSSAGTRPGLPVPAGSTEMGPALCPPPVLHSRAGTPRKHVPHREAVLKWQAEHGKSNPDFYPPI